jgi:hypothetical protein
LRVGTGSAKCRSGSRRAKITHKNRKSKEVSCFEMPNALF